MQIPVNPFSNSGMPWSEHVIEVLGEGSLNRYSNKNDTCSSFFNDSPTSNTVNWMFSATWKGAAAYMDIDISFLSSCKIYLVDSGVTFAGSLRDGYEMKNFAVGEYEAPIKPGEVKWSKVVSVGGIKCDNNNEVVKFKVRVCFRLEKSVSLPPTLPPPPPPLQSLVADFQKLLLSTVSSDVVFVFVFVFVFSKASSLHGFL